MHRMRRLAFNVGLTALILAALSSTTSAGLIRPNDTREYPDITAFANGYQSYNYDPSAKTGIFQLSNAPFQVTLGKSATGFSEVDVTPTDAGVRTQSVTAVLDSSGNLVNSPLNNFQMYGKTVIDGQTYSGLLLQGTPTGFGSLSLKPNVAGEDLFDLTLHVTGGALASLYGQNAYMRVTVEANSTFDGVFTTDFSAEKIFTNTHAISSILPTPAPEPTALYVLLACGAGLFYRGRRRISARQLEV